MPSAPLRGVLKVLLFPFGRPVRKPTDKLEHKLAQLLQVPSETRNRLASYVYLTNEPLNLVGRQAHVDSGKGDPDSSIELAQNLLSYGLRRCNV